MKYSEIKEVKDFCEGLYSEPEWREVVQCVVDGDDDFEVNNVRFIKDDCILSVMVDEIFSDMMVTVKRLQLTATFTMYSTIDKRHNRC